MNKSVNKAIDRIKNIDWNNCQSSKPCFELLVSEFIVRGNLFRDLYDANNIMRIAVFSASDIIGNVVQSDFESTINELILTEQGWTSKYLCKYYLEWSYLTDLKVEATVKNKNLYEPIIMLFERGGRITYHNNELICGKFAWPRNCYNFPRNTILKEFTNETLDLIDLKARF